MTQQHMGAPTYNDYGFQLPPQQAAAAAQHPMLAPRPTDPTATGYHSFPSQMPSSSQTQSINASSYYPAASLQRPVHMWQPQSLTHTDGRSIASSVTNYSQAQQSVQSGQINDLSRLQTGTQMTPQITSPMGQMAEEHSTRPSRMSALDPIPGIQEHNINTIPQVRIIVVPPLAAVF